MISGIFASDNIPIEMSADDSDTHPDLPPRNRSAYEYSLDCSFQALHSPDTGLLVEMLQKHHDYMGFRDKICLLSDKCKDLLASSAFWDPFAKKAIIGVQCCLTEKKDELSKMKKQLLTMERCLIHGFASGYAHQFASDKIAACVCQALLSILASAFIGILKHDMCHGVSKHGRSVADVVDKAFSMTDADVNACFSGVGDCREVKSLMECLYYVAGWHAYSIKKASIRRRAALKELMGDVYSNIIVAKDIAREMGMPIQKVERVELFGGLKYVCRNYFLFVLRMEYVFMEMFTSEKLVMMGSDLITRVYIELSSNQNVRMLVRLFACGGDNIDEINDDMMDDLVVHMVKSYCRMRGKDFVRKFMQHGFKNKNLGKGIRPTLAIVSNPLVRKVLGAAQKKKADNVAANITGNADSNLAAEDMHTMMEYTCRLLVDDDFAGEDESNLFQEV